jgi:glutamine cyclotransferase
MPPLFYTVKSQITVAFVIPVLAFLLSCNSSNNSGAPRGDHNSKTKKYWALSEPLNEQILYYNDSLRYSIKALTKDLNADSTLVFIEGKKVISELVSPMAFVRSGIFSKVGRQELRIRVFFNDSLSQTLSARITVLSDHEPINNGFKVIRTFGHDTKSFTQGLIYHKGFLYESTGRVNQSKIRKIDPANGRVLRELKMDPEIFGEGLTELHGKLYQLTYQKKVGFVYDLESFEKLQEFDLQTYEGWGLTTDGQNLIVSEGSSYLYFYDPSSFNLLNQLDVCDNKRLITSLNELEYAGGAIWANIYGQRYIVKIDARSGKVVSKLDLSSIYPQNIPDDYDHVLNGIAYNPDNSSYFVTGKLWPLVYEIVILE